MSVCQLRPAADNPKQMHGVVFLVFLNVLKFARCEPDMAKTHMTSTITRDHLIPYANAPHGSSLTHRQVRELHANKSLLPHALHPAHRSHDFSQLDTVVKSQPFQVKIGEYEWMQKVVLGRKFTVNDPALTLSVVEAGGMGGCTSNSLHAVSVTSKVGSCQLAVNAGFFNTTSGACLGNVVSDGQLAADANGLQNAHFGITKNGQLFYGYIPESAHLEEEFLQLVGGVIWLVRDGKNYVDISKESESQGTESTGGLEDFITVMSARLAVGNDAQGRVVIVQVEGKTWERGVSLYEFADLLISLGLVNAVNLDGGGSVTALLNDSLLNYSGEVCVTNNITYSCETKVSTILCIHDIKCHNSCNNHGDCYHGKCYCHDNWSGSQCEELLCGKHNCSGHGLCTENGCECEAGWTGPDCSAPCKVGLYGIDCRQPCRCMRGAWVCNRFNGRCVCPPGYTGYHCDRECAYGRYGEGCRGVCSCPDSCTCHHVTGVCHNVPANHTIMHVGQCYSDVKVVARQAVILTRAEMGDWVVTLVLGCVLCSCSLILNILLFYAHFIQKKKMSCDGKRTNTKLSWLQKETEACTYVTSGGSNRHGIGESSSDSMDEFFRAIRDMKASPHTPHSPGECIPLVKTNGAPSHHDPSRTFHQSSASESGQDSSD